MIQPLSFYTSDKVLRFFLLDVGEGLMNLIVFPDNTVMLFDCNVTNDNEEGVLSFLDHYIPEVYNSDSKSYEKPIHIFVNSHRDEDHYRGLKKVNSKFPIKSIWDSGQTGATTGSDDYKYYMYLRRELRKKNANNLFVPTPTNIEITDFAGAKVYCLAAEEDYVQDYDNLALREVAAKIQHTNSMVLLIEYKGIKKLLTGDSDWKSWKEKIVPNFKDNDFLKSNIMIASHHGSRSFFTDENLNENIDIDQNPDSTYIESIELVSPDIVLISCGNYESAHHPNKDAMKLYKNNTSEGQVYTTNSKGHLCGFIDETGYFSVLPSRFSFRTNTSSNVGFSIKCKKITNGVETALENNTTTLKGGSLKFSIESYGGLIEPFNKVSVLWEVSNGGKYSDYMHQEIYYKGKDESDGILSFSRDLSFSGTHLLRCRVKNSHKKLDITQVFVVNAL